MSTEVGSLVVKYVGDLSGLKTANAQVKTLLQSTGSAAKTATASMSSGLKSASTAASQLTTATKNTTSAVSQLATSAASSSKNLLSGFKNAASGILDFGNKLGGSITAIKGVADGAIGLGQALLSPAANAEQMQIAFTSLLGSGQAATQMLQTLGNIAVKTPFELPQVQEAAKQLLAFKFNAADVPNMLLRIGDAVESVGGGAEGMQSVIVALGQMKLKGKATGEEMLQLTERNIDAWGYVAKALGVSTAQAQQMASKGLIPADTAIKAIIAGMGEFKGAMDKQSASALGLASTLKDAFNINILANFGKGLLEPLKASMQGLIALLSNPAIAQAASLLGTQIGGALSGLISGFSTLVSKGSGITSFFQQIAQGWQGIFSDAEGGSAIPGIIAAFGRLQQAVQNFGAVIGPSVGPILLQFNSLLTTTAGWLVSLVAPALDMVSQRVGALTAFLQPVAAAFSPLLIAVENLVNVLGPVAVGAANLAAQSGLLSVAMGLAGTAVAGLMSALTGIINGIADVIRFFEQNQAAAALLGAAIGTLAVAFAAFKITSFVQGLAAIAPIMYTLISGAIPGMIAGLGEMAVAGWTAIAPFLPFIAIGAAVVAVIAGIILVVRNWGAIVDWLQQQWQRFTGWFSGAINALEKIPGIGAVVTAFTSAWNTISSTAQAAWSNVSTNAATALDAIKAKGGEIGGWFQTTWQNISTSAQTNLGPPLTTLWQNISTKAQETTGTIGKFFQDAWNVAKQAWSQSPLSGAFNATVKAVQAAPGAAGQTLAQGLAPVGQTLGGIGANVQAALGPAMAGVQSGFGNLGASFSQIGQQVSATLKPALDGLNQVLGQIGQMAQSTLVPAWQSLQGAMSQIGTVLSGGFTQAWQALQQAMSQIGTVVSTTLVPAWQQLQTALAPIVAAVSGAFAQAWQALQQAFTAIAPILAQIGTTLSGAFTTAWTILAPILSQIATVVGGALTQAWTVLQPILAQIGAAIGGQLLVALQTLGIVIGGVVLLAISLLLGVLVGVAQAFATFISGVATAVSGIITFFSGLVTFLSGIVAFIIDLFTGNFGKLSADLQVIWQGVVLMFQGIWTTIVGLFQASVGTVVAFVQGLVTTVVNFFTNLYNSLVGHSIIPDLINGIVQWFQGLPAKIMEFITQMVTNVINAFTNFKNQAIQKATDIINGIKNVFAGLPAQATQWMTDFGNNLVSGLKGMLDKVKKAATDVAAAITSPLHNTEPDEGPMRGNTKWMPHLGDNLVHGLKAQVGRVKLASMEVAASIAAPYAPDASVYTPMSSGVAASMAAHTAAEAGSHTFVLEVDSRELARITGTASGQMTRLKFGSKGWITQ